MNKKLEEKAARIAKDNGFEYDDVFKLLECGVNERSLKRMLADKKAGLSSETKTYSQWHLENKGWVTTWLLPIMAAYMLAKYFHGRLSSRVWEVAICAVAGVCLSEIFRRIMYYCMYSKMSRRFQLRRKKTKEFLQSTSSTYDEALLLSFFDEKTAARLKKRKRRLVELQNRREEKKNRREEAENEAEAWRQELIMEYCGCCRITELKQDAATMESNRTMMAFLLWFLQMMATTFVACIPVAVTRSVPWYSVVIFCAGVALGVCGLLCFVFSKKSQKRRFIRVVKKLHKDAVIKEVTGAEAVDMLASREYVDKINRSKDVWGVVLQNRRR